VSKYVGIVGEGGGPLYCRVDSDGYWVINGEWLLGRDGKIHGPNDYNHFIKYKIVISDMKPKLDYNEACELIRQVEEEGECSLGQTHGEYTTKLREEVKDNLCNLRTRELYDLCRQATNEDEDLRRLLINDILKSDDPELYEEAKTKIEWRDDRDNCPKCGAEHSMEATWGANEYRCIECRHTRFGRMEDNEFEEEIAF
jgi:NADH pyrophosphatase NudC (nudix superfamily)